ncbi:MAG: phosphatase PAP2 family protein [Leptospirillia bacterium]
MAPLITIDQSLFLWLNNSLARPWLDPVMEAATALGNGFYLFPLGLLLMTLFAKRNFRRDFVFWASTSFISFIIGTLLKHLVHRDRPLAALHARIDDHQATVHVLGPSLYANSFPSGHTFTVFSTASLFAGLYPGLAIPLYTVATLTGLSRIYVGAHFPLDVLGGALIGLLSTAIVRRWIIPRWKDDQTPAPPTQNTKPSR